MKTAERSLNLGAIEFRKQALLRLSGGLRHLVGVGYYKRLLAMQLSRKWEGALRLLQASVFGNIGQRVTLPCGGRVAQLAEQLTLNQ